jgi:hypothetical protein
MLENGVSLSVDPATLGNSGQGRFPQVSGLCFTYDIAAPSGNRVTSAVVANADGSCTATPVDLTAGTTYKTPRTTSWRPAATGTRTSPAG